MHDWHFKWTSWFPPLVSGLWAFISDSKTLVAISVIYTTCLLVFLIRDKLWRPFKARKDEND